MDSRILLEKLKMISVLPVLPDRKGYFDDSTAILNTMRYIFTYTERRVIMSRRYVRSIICLVALSMLLSLLSICSTVRSGTTVDRFSDGSSTKVYTPGDPPGVVLPAGCTIMHASLDLEGRAVQGGENAILNFNRTKTTGWSGTSSEDPPFSTPPAFKGREFAAQERTTMASEDGNYVRSLADGGTGAGPYHHFSFNITGDPALLTGLNVRWVGRGEEPLVDMLNRYKASIYIWNDADNSWELLDSYGLTELSGHQVLKGEINSGFSDYIDGDGHLHILARSWIWGTFEAYLDTDYVELNVSCIEGMQYVFGPVLRLEQGGDPVWAHTGRFTEAVTLGDAVLKGPIQEMSNRSVTRGDDDLTVYFLLHYTGGGEMIFSNLSIEYGIAPEPIAEEIRSTLDEDTDVTDLIDLSDHFRDDGPASELSFEIIYREDASKVDAFLDQDGARMSFTTTADDWYGELGFGVRVTDGDGLFVDFNEIRLTVEPVNDDPVALGMPELRVVEDEPCPLDLLDLWNCFEDGGWNEDDVRNLTFMLPEQSNPKYSDGTAVGVIRENRYFTCSSREDFNGQVEFVIEVFDTEGEMVRDDLTVIFEPVNDPPMISSTPSSSTNENENYSYRIEVEDIDGDVLEAAVEEGPETMIIENMTVYWTPDDPDVGEHNISLSISDGQETIYQNYTIEVTNVNDPPAISPMEGLIGTVGRSIEFTVTADDPDIGPDPREKLTFLDDSDLFEIDYETGEVFFVPSWTQVGEYSINITVTDRLGSSFTRDLALNIDFAEGVSAPDVDITSPLNGTEIKVGKEQEFTASIVAEFDGDWEFTWLMDGTVAAQGKAVVLTFDTEGAHTVKVRASDGNGTVEDEIIVMAKPGSGKADGDDSPGFEVVGTILAAFVIVSMCHIVRRN